MRFTETFVYFCARWQRWKMKWEQGCGFISCLYMYIHSVLLSHSPLFCSRIFSHRSLSVIPAIQRIEYAMNSSPAMGRAKERKTDDVGRQMHRERVYTKLFRRYTDLICTYLYYIYYCIWVCAMFGILFFVAFCTNTLPYGRGMGDKYIQDERTSIYSMRKQNDVTRVWLRLVAWIAGWPLSWESSIVLHSHVYSVLCTVQYSIYKNKHILYELLSANANAYLSMRDCLPMNCHSGKTIETAEQSIIGGVNKSFIQIAFGLQRNKLSRNKTRDVQPSRRLWFHSLHVKKL